MLLCGAGYRERWTKINSLVVIMAVNGLSKHVIYSLLRITNYYAMTMMACHDFDAVLKLPNSKRRLSIGMPILRGKVTAVSNNCAIMQKPGIKPNILNFIQHI